MKLSSCAVPLNALGGLALLVLLALAPVGVRADHPVPFRASFTTQFESVVEFPIAHITVVGTGHSLHMGQTDAASNDQAVNLLTGEGAATYTLAAANGDTVVLSISFTTESLPNGVAFAGAYTVTGGTGRFAGATGSGAASGAAIFTGPSGGVGSFELDGTISK